MSPSEEVERKLRQQEVVEERVLADGTGLLGLWIGFFVDAAGSRWKRRVSNGRTWQVMDPNAQQT